MPGAHGKRRSKKPNAAPTIRELLFKEDGQAYAKITKTLGAGRFLGSCDDGVQRLCKLRGKMRRSEWVSVGDVVLVGLREFQDAKADLLCKYTDLEVRNLKKYDELQCFEDVPLSREEEYDDDDLVEFVDDI